MHEHLLVISWPTIALARLDTSNVRPRKRCGDKGRLEMSREQIFAILKEVIQSTIAGTEQTTITEQHSFRDLNADSLEIVEVVSLTLKQLDLRLSRAELASARNLGDLVTTLENAKNNAA